MSVTLQEQARELYVPGIVGYKQVAKLLGVSQTTVRRWLDPEMAERNRVSSREAKRRRSGTCRRCGGETRYSGNAGKGVSDLCEACAHEEQRESRGWTREAVVDAIQRWAVEHGRPPSATDWNRSGPGHPAKSNVYRSGNGPRSNNPFANWADAIEAAGFDRPEVGGRYRERPWVWSFDHDEATRLLAEGLSQAEVARRLGVSHSTINKLALNGGTYAQTRDEVAA